MFSWLVLFAVFTAAQGRAVNISNAWVLPEEGFPVFYRYFRDRISWYEADAVCQFHHANLVTVDTTAQYDAVRAYLKELDISTAVWVGLIRSNPDGEFTWTDYRGLSGDGYWSSAPDTRTAPLCAAANPGADYRWEARSCGGPTVASFICELPVPQWALGNEGCMVQNIPALTILYLPESAAVQLTADCGLAEVKKVQCTGNVKREVLLKDLACVEEETTTTSLKIITSDITTERENTSDITPEDITTLSTSEKLINKSTSTVTTLFDLTTTENTNSDENKLDKVYMNKNIHIDFISHNNIQSNDIPRIAGKDDDFIEEQLARKEDAKTKQLLMMHEELARHGNFANNDHFVPPLVMAKAKLNDDMTVLSVQEKHAQQLAQQGVLNYKNTHKEIVPLESEITKSHNNKEEIKEEKSITKKADISSNVKKDTIIKSQIPKKYNEKYISIKGKYTNPMETKNEEIITSQPSTKITIMEPTTMVNVNKFYKITTDNPVELKVVFKEPVIALHSSPIPYTDIPHTDNIIKLVEPESVPSTESDNINVTTESQSTSYKLNDEIIKITVIKGADSPQPFTTEVFEVSTKVPVFYSTEDTTHTTGITVTEQNTSKSGITEDTTVISTSPTTTIIPSTQTNNLTSEHSTPSDVSITTEAPNFVNITETENSTFIDINTSPDTNNATVVEDKVITNHTILTNGTEVEAEHGTDSLEEEIDDKNSPLLSGASEPLRRPPRIRRPQQQNNIKKFNPFRILG